MDNLKSVKAMLLDIGVILIGGILLVDPNSTLFGFEYIMLLAGFIGLVIEFKRK